MPELRSDSPIMEGLMAGQCFTEHDGVHCYPAIRLETGDKYIIKVVSVPASETQTEALLLTGAISDAEDAKRYFHTLAQEVVAETRTLNSLALLEGFVGCEQVHCEENDAGDGYLVYILTPYRESAEALLKQSDLSQLAALNLGLDLCAALTACRRAGFMYVDLKPDNIFKNEKGAYCIGDIGFITLRSLKYASLPEKYRSNYTAPEMADCFAQLNDTLDVYALGLVLYQMYNAGTLPNDVISPDEPLPPPVYADYELSEIILKACDPDPANRWQEPAAIGQALTDYIQRNAIMDAPIIPVPPAEEPEEEIPADEATEEFLPDMTEEELLSALEEEEVLQSGEQDELQLIAALAAEDALAGGELSEGDQEATDEDTAQMLAQAEELMTLIPPEPVVAPEAIHVPIPAPIVDEPVEPQEAPEQDALNAAEPTSEEDTAEQEEKAPPIMLKRQKSKKKLPWGKLTAILVVLLLLCGIGFGGYYYYNNVYLQCIDAIHVTGTDSTATVTVITDIDESLLTLVCTDSYGNSHTAKLENGVAQLEKLNPQTNYTVTLRIQGFHKLLGEISQHFTTASRTDIQSFQASIGPVDGSVTLTFTSSGPDPNSWKVICSAQGQDTIVQEFTGTAVTITGLNIGSEYTFLLEPVGELFLSGQTQVSFTAVKLVYAQNPVIDACHDGLLHVTWSAPEDTVVESWTLHCYNASGYEQTVTTTDLEYTFRDLDHSTATTVEITAAGMNKAVSVTIGPDPVTVWSFSHTPEVGVGIQLNWVFTEKAPAGGWNLHWSIDGAAQQPIACAESTAFIPMYIPGGVFEFTLEAADSTHVFGSSFTLTLPEAESLNLFGVTNADLLCRSFRAPAEEFSWQELLEDSFTDTFTVTDTARLLLSTQLPIEASENTVLVSYILRSQDGNIVSTANELLVWNTMWTEGGCILAPSLPQTAGNYVLSVYFDNMRVCDIPLTIV